MKNIYCVKLTDHCEQPDGAAYVLLRFKDDDQDLISLIATALHDCNYCYVIESRHGSGAERNIAPGDYFAAQRDHLLLGRTVTIDLPRINMVPLLLTLTKRLEETTLFDLVSIATKAYMAEIVTSKACTDGDPLGVGNARFMVINPDPELRNQAVMSFNQPERRVVPGMIFPEGYNHQPPLHTEIDAFLTPSTPTPEEEIHLMPLDAFLAIYKVDLENALHRHGYSKTRITNQMSRLSNEYPAIKQLADEIVNGRMYIFKDDTGSRQVKVSGVDFNQF